MPLHRLHVLAVILVVGCSAPAEVHAPSPSARPTPPQARAREGITIDHLQGPTPVGMGDGVITLVRFDMRRYALRMFVAGSRDGRARTLPEWAAEVARAGNERLVGAINLAMYEPDGRPTSFVLEDGVERSPDDERFGGFLAFGAVREGDTPWLITGRDCEGGDLSVLRARYRNVVANYRMLSCERAPIAWVDEHRYSSAAFGVDTEGRLVLVHAATPYLMRDLARVLAQPSLGLVQVDYVEGGPEATLFVDDGVRQTTLIGYPRDAAERRPDQAPYPPEQVGRPWPLPNVLGVVALPVEPME